MEVQKVNSALSTQYISKSRELGKNEFLKLLVAQLRYQNPLRPLEDKEFISQLAQFNSLEQMINLNTSFEKMVSWQKLLQASSLIGKKVLAKTPDDIVGVVSQVMIIDGSVSLVVNNQEVKLEQIISIF